MLLELGILSHSVLIGAAAGVSVGSDFWSLVAALMVHQGFEGVALASVVSEERRGGGGGAGGVEGEEEVGREVREATGRGLVWTVLAYCLATPLGGFIGMMVLIYGHMNMQAYLLVEGVLDAASAGILTYNALVNILQPHFSSLRFRSLPVSAQMGQLVCLWLGAGVMATIGFWT
ncbi:high-affinity Zn(2+) transporter zrt1 [Dinochytrium kinnereticum]|nr:high-affinity Zn(2+) transporter zrt1 [Dinochytrium kinnereticum]